MLGKMGFLLFSAAFFFAVSTQMAAARFNVPAIIVFGDSTVDVGNNNFLPGEQAKANFPHNGIDFPGGIPTGRFSNGFNGVDYLAMKLGFEKSPPAHLSITTESEMHNGANFASGGSGILDDTGRNVSISLNQQIADYEKLRQILKSQIGSPTADRYLSESIFLFSTGNNDMLGLSAKSEIYNEDLQNSLVEQLASQFELQLQTVYSLGARKFVIFGSSMLGCGPLPRRDVPNGGCLEHLNNLSQNFNRATEKVLGSLASTLEGFSYSFVNVYDVVAVLSSNPQKYGFTDLSSACCGSGRLNADSSCTPEATYCSDRNEFFFWDRLHPTQATSKLIASAAFHGREYATPLTVEELALSSGGH